MGSKPDDSKIEELKKIEELHERDREASLNGDFATLQSLFTEEAVILPPGGHRIRGAEQLRANFMNMKAAYEDTTVSEYRLDFEEVCILGNFAYEWGTISGASRTGDGEIERTAYQVMRILKKTGAGEWKVHRTIWNNALPRQSYQASAGMRQSQ